MLYAKKGILLFVFCLTALFSTAGKSYAVNFTFDVSLVSRVLDPVRSANDTLGFDNWYVWTYRIDVKEGSSNKYALSNWVLQLPDCYISSKDLFREIEASADAGGGDQIRIYETDHVHPDPNLDLYGLKWDEDGGDELDTPGEYDFFWFSVPTDLDIEGDWGVKAGKKKIFGEIEIPSCPTCQPGVPEPAGIFLFSSGLIGIFLKRRKKGRNHEKSDQTGFSVRSSARIVWL